MEYHVYFRRPDDCVVYAPATEHQEVSLLHRMSDARWHCALCDADDCRHADAAASAAEEAADIAESGGARPLFTVPRPNG